jgi:hypothetical protein
MRMLDSDCGMGSPFSVFSFQFSHVSGSNGAAHTSPGYNPGIGVKPRDRGTTPGSG